MEGGCSLNRCEAQCDQKFSAFALPAHLQVGVSLFLERPEGCIHLISKDGSDSVKERVKGFSPDVWVMRMDT